MRVICIWRKNADYSHSIRDWLTDFERMTSKKIESFDPDSSEGEVIAQLYDIPEYPAILALDNDGRELERWCGTRLPIIDQVSYYAEEK